MPILSRDIPQLTPVVLGVVRNAVSSLPEDGDSVAASIARPIRAAVQDVDAGRAGAELRSLADLIGKQRQIIEDKLGAPLPTRRRRGL